jgi:hypothetical protein
VLIKFLCKFKNVEILVFLGFVKMTGFQNRGLCSENNNTPPYSAPSLIKLTKNFTVSRRNHPLNQMAPNPTGRIQKKWVAQQLRHAASLKTLAGVQRFQKNFLEKLEDETDTKPRSVRQYPGKPIYSKITFAHKLSSS